jgi:transcriptional regulator with XRE-family HTH domain
MILFSKRLKEKRKELGFTQKQLGEMVGVTKVSICCYESGTRTPTLDTLVDLANALQVELTYLLGADYFVVAEDNPHSAINLAQNEIELIRELRMHIKLYERFLEDPKRTMDYIEKKLR